MSIASPGCQGDEDEAGPLFARQRSEAQLIAIDLPERLAAVHPAQPAGSVVDPAVVGAGEPTRFAAAVGHDDRTAVTTGVDEGERSAVRPPT